MEKVRLFLLFSFWGISLAFSQTVQDNNQFIPPSPTVGELGKYGMIPVSYYTGVPDISIPLYTIECRSLKLPLTLSYHAGGIKVEQIASWVGLGWSLNAGGVISASIMGVSDFRDRIDIPDFDDINADRLPTQAELNGMGKYYDAQPDIYNYSINGNSGQFVLDNSFSSNEIRNNKKIKITANKSDTTFTIINDEGIIYEFKDKELTRTDNYHRSFDIKDGRIYGENSDGYKDNNNTGWFLSNVISPDHTDTIRFFYAPEQQSYQTKYEGNIDYDIGKSDWQKVGILNYARITNRTKRLTRIEGNNGLKIDITADAARADLTGSNRLDKIKIYYENNLIKQWDFTYTYFQSLIQNTTDAKLNKRLRLDNITENQTKSWNFHYFGDDNGEHQMPYRTAFCGSDYWGFHNSTINNNDLANPEKLFPNANGTFTYTFIQTEQQANCQLIDVPSYTPVQFNYSDGSNKNPNFDFMKTYTLKSISYPTGGYSDFTYEPHDYSMIGDSVMGSDKICGGLRIKEIKNYSSDGNLATKNAYQYKLLSDEMLTPLSNSSGSVINEFTAISEKWFVKEYQHATEGGMGSCGVQNFVIIKNYITLNSASYTSLYSYGGDYIGYSYVTETNENGSTRYNFSSISDFPNHYMSYSMYLYAKDSDINPSMVLRNIVSEHHNPFQFGYWGKTYGRGLLKNKYVFNANNQKVHTEKNIYELNDINRIYGWEIEVADKVIGTDYYANCYFHQTGQALLTENQTTEYDLNGANPVETNTAYTYNRYNQPNQITTTNSDGKIHKTTYTYGWQSDHPQNHLSMLVMAAEHILTPITEQVDYVNNNQTNALVNEYRLLEKDHLTPVLSKVYSGKSTSTLETRVNYEKYDKYNNPAYVIKDNAEKVVYLWGYKGQYPIAEIKNATYADITSKITAANLDKMTAKTEPSDIDFMDINYLRTQLPNTQITTYTYKPLIGILRVTDPRDIRTTYEYDSFGRLQTVKDGNNKVVENYEYHYKN
jgi:YD repeat-containing protein